VLSPHPRLPPPPPPALPPMQHREVDTELAPSWVTGITEVPLSMEARLKNIEATETAKLGMLVKGGAKGGGRVGDGSLKVQARGGGGGGCVCEGGLRASGCGETLWGYLERCAFDAAVPPPDSSPMRLCPPTPTLPPPHLPTPCAQSGVRRYSFPVKFGRTEEHEHALMAEARAKKAAARTMFEDRKKQRKSGFQGW
jgi:hypothetical protein